MLFSATWRQKSQKIDFNFMNVFRRLRVCANGEISRMDLTRRVPTPRTRCNRHHCWQCSSRCCRSRCCSPAVPPSAHGRVPPPSPWGWLEFSSRKSGSRERRIVTRNVSTAAARRPSLLSIGEEFSDVTIREDP